MEFALLVKIGAIINVIVKSGYVLAGGYIVKTGVTYVSDYRRINKDRAN